MEKDRQAYPLKDKRVVITRAREQAGEFARLVRERGGIPVLFPTIAFVPLEPEDFDWSSLDSYHIIIFTSANGVDFFLKLLESHSLRFPEGASVVAIGPGTAKRLEEAGVKVSLLPDRFIAEGIVEALGDVRGRRILIPRAKVAREVLPRSLKSMGAHVDVLPVYETVVPSLKDAPLDQLRSSHVITFTSPSTVANFVKMLGKEAYTLCEDKVVASIGPVTTSKAIELGIEVDVTSEVHSVEGLLDALCQFLSQV